MKARKTHDMESCKEADIEENVELPKESLQKIEFVSIGEQDSVVESIFDSKDKEYDAFNLDVSLTLLDTETDEVDAEFLEALTEIEGKKSLPCPKCIKICKSKGGLTKYTNSKHRESDPELSTESGNNHNCLLLEDLAGVVESIKTNLIVGDLYGPVINTAIKRRFFRKSRIFCENRPKLSDQAFARKCSAASFCFESFPKIFAKKNRILLDFWLCHEAKHC